MKIHHATPYILYVAEQMKSPKDQVTSTFLNLRPGSFRRMTPWIIKFHTYYSIEGISNNDHWNFLVKMPFAKKRSDLRSSRTISKHLNFFTAFSFEEEAQQDCFQFAKSQIMPYLVDSTPYFHFISITLKFVTCLEDLRISELLPATRGQPWFCASYYSISLSSSYK